MAARKSERSRVSSTTWVIGGIALVAVALVAVLIWATRPAAGQDPVSELGPEASLQRGQSGPAIHTLGSADAPVTMRIYEDLGCPSCKALWATSEEQVVEMFVQPGDVQLEIYTVAIVNAQSLPAAEGAACAAEQNGYWEYRDVLFNNQGVVAFSRENLIDFASQVGLDTDEFAECFDRARYKNQIMSQSQAAVSQGVEATPTIDISGTRVRGVVPFERPETGEPGLRQLLEQALMEAES